MGLHLSSPNAGEWGGSLRYATSVGHCTQPCLLILTLGGTRKISLKFSAIYA